MEQIGSATDQGEISLLQAGWTTSTMFPRNQITKACKNSEPTEDFLQYVTFLTEVEQKLIPDRFEPIRGSIAALGGQNTTAAIRDIGRHVWSLLQNNKHELDEDKLW
jgi:hypothetical protein